MAYLELTDLRKSFATTVAVNRFSLSVEKGEFVSFLGPSGCGKTTTMRMVAGFEQPDQGAITLDGADLTRVSPNKRNIGMVFQSYALFPHLTVRDNITFGMSLAGASKSAMQARATELLDLIQLPKLGDRYPSQLSGGQQQRVALARAIALKPRVLLLDEPLSALDAKIRDELRNEIRRIQQNLGITAIYVTHDQSEALALSDRVVVMNNGDIEQIGTPFEIYNRPASAFVAGFVGTQSQLQAVLTADPSVVTIAHEHVRLAAPVNGGKAGDAVYLRLRPELISLTATEGANSLSGVVEQITFLGSVIRTQVSTAGGSVSIDTLNNPNLTLVSPGAAIRITFSPEAVSVRPLRA
jgi:putative spermidine/putrescine transport system ATP-binding protein